MLAGTALDVLEIDAASNRGIDEIRALRDAVKFAPATMRMKVYIIDEAHMLTKEGANAFLKTLEEPPPHAVFILATTEPEKLPVTILSRCQRYAFRRIAIPVMIERMQRDRRGREDRHRRRSAGRDRLSRRRRPARRADDARAARGLLRRRAGDGRDARPRLRRDGPRLRAGARSTRSLARDAAAALADVEEASDAGTDMQVLIRSLIAAFRNLLGRAHRSGAAGARPRARGRAARAARQADVSQAMLVRALRTFGEALALARSGGNARLELETALLRFILTAEDPTLDALAARVAALEERGGARAVASPAPSREPPAPDDAEPKTGGRSAPQADASGALSLQKVRAAWQSIRGKVEGERQSLRAPLSRAAIEALESNAIVLKLPDTWSADALRDHAPLIEAAIADVSALPLQGDAASGRQAPGARRAARRPKSDGPDALFDYANERIR